MSGWDRSQAQQGHRIIIGGDPIVPFGSAAGTAMDQHLLSIRPIECADGWHQCPAVARPVTGMGAINMAGVQAARTVIAMLAPRDGRSDKGPAMAAFELLRTVRFALVFGPRLPGSWFAANRFSCGLLE